MGSFTNPYPASRLTLDSTNSLVTGMQLWFPFTTGSGTSAPCLLHSSHDGTLQSGASWASSDIGTVLELDGSSEVDFTTDISRNKTAVSCSAWIKPDSVSSNHFVFFESNNNNSQQTRFGLAIVGGRVRCGGRDDDGDSFTIFAQSNTNMVVTGAWQHVVAVFDPTGGGCKVYLDGVDVTASSINTGDGFPDTASINQVVGGIGGNSAFYFDGQIQNLKVWDRAITAAEVATLYHRPWEGTNFGDIWPYSPPVPSSMVLSSDASSTSLMNGCQAWYPLTEGAGSTATCIMGHSAHNGTLDTGVTWETSERGTAAKFDGTDYAKITLGSEPVSGQTISVSAWVYSEETSGVQAIYCSRQSGFPDSKNYLMYNAGTPSFGWDQYPPSGGGTGSGTISDARGRWVHVVATQDATTSKIYVDGELKGSAASETYSNTAGAHYIGYRYSAQAMTGSIQNLRIWDRVLSADEALLLYERPWEGEASYGDVFYHDPPAPASMLPLDNASGINTGLAAWYPLTETDDYASGVTDISGGAYHGSAHNGASSKSSLIGSVADFDGSNDYMNLGTSFWNDNIASGDDFCVNFWFNVDDISSDGAILGCWSTEQNFFIWVDVGGANVSLTSIGSGVGYGYTSVDLPVVEADRWYMGTLVADGTAGTVSVYLDGVFKVSASYSASLSTNTEPMGLASERGSSNQRQMDGRIGNVRFWSRVLTADEIWSIYSNPWLGSNYKLASGSTPLYNYIFRTERFRRLA